MNEPIDLDARRTAARRRRATGVVADFDPARLSLARRLAALPRTRVGKAVGVTPAAVTQFEKGQSRPTVAVVELLAEALGVTTDFFRASHPMPELGQAGAHFRSLRSTTAAQREQALAFGELTLAVFAALEQHVELPPARLPELNVPVDLLEPNVALLATEARAAMDVPSGPIPHVVRLLEVHGVAVVHLDQASQRVDAFSHQEHEHRPLVLLNPAKQDKARSRFDAAHELGHLLMHHDTEPGSRLVERQAHAFAAEFLAPATEIADDLPSRADWVALQKLKRRWGISLKALVTRAHHLGKFSDATYRMALRHLATQGLPEAGSLGALEQPVLLPRAAELLGGTEEALAQLAADSGLTETDVQRVWRACGGDTARTTELADVSELDAESIR
jgi:Zn-dependent peptidase ImmA (M78 family)/transcriptional regulator with XRE-family HTH domain